MAYKKNLKGIYNGLCNVTACQAPGATWYNRSTQKHYCRNCAWKINQFNRDEAIKLYGGPLCIEKKDLSKTFDKAEAAASGF